MPGLWRRLILLKFTTSGRSYFVLGRLMRRLLESLAIWVLVILVTQRTVTRSCLAFISPSTTLTLAFNRVEMPVESWLVNRWRYRAHDDKLVDLFWLYSWVKLDFWSRIGHERRWLLDINRLVVLEGSLAEGHLEVWKSGTHVSLTILPGKLLFSHVVCTFPLSFDLLLARLTYG